LRWREPYCQSLADLRDFVRFARRQRILKLRQELPQRREMNEERQHDHQPDRRDGDDVVAAARRIVPKPHQVGVFRHLEIVTLAMVVTSSRTRAGDSDRARRRSEIAAEGRF